MEFKMVYNSNVSSSTASMPQKNNTPSNVMLGLRQPMQQPMQQAQQALPQFGVSASPLDTNQYGTVTDYASMLAPKPNNNLVARAALIGAAVAFGVPLVAPMFGRVAKSAFGLVKKSLPQVENIASQLGKSVIAQGVVGNALGNVVSSVISGKK